MSDKSSLETKALILGHIIKLSGETFTDIGFKPGIATTLVILEALGHSSPDVMNDVLSKLTQFSITLLREMGKTELADILEHAE